MKRSTGLRVILWVTLWATAWPSEMTAQTLPALPSPLNLADVIRIAADRRDEIEAARAGIRAGEARPIIVSALADPMIAPSLDHLPFMLGGADVSVTTTDVRTCSLRTNLAAAAALMLDGDCGILPVVDEGKLVGVVTDRDMYIALATRNTLASQLTVGEVARQQVWTCGPDDDVRAALATMKQRRVRRLPVEGFGGTAPCWGLSR